MNDLENLNKLEVIDYDVDTNKALIYVHVEDNEENRKTLTELGATEYDFIVMKKGLERDNVLDITLFAFANLSAEYWSIKNGFSMSS